MDSEKKVERKCDLCFDSGTIELESEKGESYSMPCPLCSSKVAPEQGGGVEEQIKDIFCPCCVYNVRSKCEKPNDGECAIVSWSKQLISHRIADAAREERERIKEDIFRIVCSERQYRIGTIKGNQSFMDGEISMLQYIHGKMIELFKLK